MIIINDAEGQLCNRLWAYSSFISFAKKHNIKIVISYFNEYIEYFEDLSSTADVYFIKQNNISSKVIFFMYEKILKILFKINSLFSLNKFCIHIDNKKWKTENWSLSELKMKNNIFFLGAWNHKKDDKAIIQYKTTIVNLFQPKKIYTEKVNALFSKLRLEYELIVGIHIRRGDYKEYRDGIYFYDNQTYNNFMTAIQKIHSGKKICFFISSNETIDYSFFSDKHITSISDALLIEDLYGLSKCDYILGPPSTYSMWASYINDIPLRIIHSKNDVIQEDDFSPIINLNVFKNGDYFSHIES